MFELKADCKYHILYKCIYSFKIESLFVKQNRSLLAIYIMIAYGDRE